MFNPNYIRDHTEKTSGLHARQAISDHPQTIFQTTFTDLQGLFFLPIFMTEELMKVIYNSGNLIVDERKLIKNQMKNSRSVSDQT